MRVIAGKAKGRRLKPVPGTSTRPITDRAKEALFSILGSDVAGSRFLDLFAGTGQVGIEALSRGADAALFVEQAAPALRTIKENLALTGLEPAGRIVRADVFQFLHGTPEPFDYIYVAPPQYHGWWADALRILDEKPGWLAEDGWAIAQIHPREYEALPMSHLVEFDRREYGSVTLLFYAAGVLESE